MLDIQHPEITWAERTGYPSWNQPNEVRCERCKDYIYDYEVYEDESYDCLCMDCLLELHLRKETHDA